MEVDVFSSRKGPDEMQRRGSGHKSWANFHLKQVADKADLTCIVMPMMRLA